MKAAVIDLIEQIRQFLSCAHRLGNGGVFIGKLFIGGQRVLEGAGKFAGTVRIFQDNAYRVGQFCGQGVILLEIRLHIRHGGVFHQFFHVIDLGLVFLYPSGCKLGGDTGLALHMGTDTPDRSGDLRTSGILHAYPVINSRIKVEQVQSVLIEQQMGDFPRIIIEGPEFFKQGMDVARGMVKIAGDKLVFL